jgi:hypothetical protein
VSTSEYEPFTTYLPELNKELAALGEPPCGYGSFWKFAAAGLIEEIKRTGKTWTCRSGTAPQVAKRIVELRRAGEARSNKFLNKPHPAAPAA